MTDKPATRHRFTLVEWIGVDAGIVALVASFLPWYRLADNLVGRAAPGAPTSTTAWQMNFLGWFPVVALLAVSVLIMAQLFGRQIQMLTSLWMTLAVLGVVMILLRWITVPKSGGEPALVAGFGLYLGLGAAIVSLVTGFLAFRGSQRAQTAD
ncbi:hypothetical protein [Actinocrispum sp. NPDC049592]|uniref:hypothetical protein n=1 Tax=Actinocrispum sp. NPDC049592 TaxID=3154835 RepID=UPI0034494112